MSLARQQHVVQAAPSSLPLAAAAHSPAALAVTLPLLQLVSLHFTGEPPSLQAQLLPLPLAELNAGGEA